MYDVHHKMKYRQLKAAVTYYTYTFSDDSLMGDPSAWGYSWYPNLHDSVELVLMDSGSVRWTISDREYRPKPGDILVVNPFELHASTMTVSEGASATYYLVHIDLDEYIHTLGKDGADALRRVLSGEEAFETFLAAGESGDTAAVIRRMHAEFANDGASPAGQCRMQAMVFTLLATLLTRCSPAVRSENERRRYSFMRNVEWHSGDHYFQEDLSTEKIAAAMNYSAAHFGRLYKECYGTGFQRYLRSWRIRKAAWGKEFREYSISEIAEKVGFRDYNYFSRAFKQELGLTPTEWYARRRAVKGQIPFTAE
ncbi:MAG: AraC family transcriptional regulator [Clostridia bacterium]|nr:AraC family transcriptional regulator [Clostridia bacterium]